MRTSSLICRFLLLAFLPVGCQSPLPTGFCLTHEMSQLACESARRELPSPGWDTLYDLQGVYCFDFEKPDDGLDSGTPNIMILLPQYAGKHYYGVTTVRVFQDHHMEDPEIECLLNTELRGDCLYAPDNRYVLRFKRDAAGKIVGFIKKYRDDETEYHFRREIGHSDFR